MAKLVFIFACVALFQIANALQCYHCDSQACEKAMDTWQKSNCAKPGDPNSQESACLKQVYKDKASQKETISRKCILTNKNQQYQCSDANGATVSCEVCTSDLCNSSAGISLSFVAIAGMLLALVVPKFLV